MQNAKSINLMSHILAKNVTNVDDVENLLKEMTSADVNHKHTQRNGLNFLTPLAAAVLANKPKVLERLLKVENIEVNAHIVVILGKADKFDQAPIEIDYNMGQYATKDCSPIMLATMRGAIECLKVLLADQRVFIGGVDNEGDLKELEHIGLDQNKVEAVSLIRKEISIRQKRSSGDIDELVKFIENDPAKMNGNKKKKCKKGKKKACSSSPSKENQPASEIPEVTKSTEEKVKLILTIPPFTKLAQRKHAWNPLDSSKNIEVKKGDEFTIQRNQMAKSSDGIRTKVGYSRGVHAWEVTYPVNQRGSHASVGVATNTADLHRTGYHSLVGIDRESWGWDLVKKKAIHDTVANPVQPGYPNFEKEFVIPEKFHMILDMDVGVLCFEVGGRYLGVAHGALGGKVLYPMVSSVWGNCEVSVKYLCGMDTASLVKIEKNKDVVDKTNEISGAIFKVDQEIELNKIEKEKLASKQSKDLADLVFKAEQIEYMMTNNEKKIAKLAMEEYELKDKLESVVAEKEQIEGVTAPLYPQLKETREEIKNLEAVNAKQQKVLDEDIDKLLQKKLELSKLPKIIKKEDFPVAPSLPSNENVIFDKRVQERIEDLMAQEKKNLDNKFLQKQIEFLEKQIHSIELSLECPVCLDTASSPIYQCQESHLICGKCRPKVSACPECRLPYAGKPQRNRYAENDAGRLEKLNEEKLDLFKTLDVQ